MLKEKLNDNLEWNKYLNSKLNKNFLTKKEKKELESFISNKEYSTIVNSIINNNYIFSTAKKHIISKNHSNKKRIVYNYTLEEMYVLKYIAYLLYDYDYLFNKNLYSFRKKTGVKTAIKNISKIKNIKNMYGYKVDIKNYFNSINTPKLLQELKVDIKDDLLYKIFDELLNNKYVSYNNENIIEEKGVMAGMPLSAFLANYYLKDLDNYFWNEKVVYLRYADDIIIFCNTLEDIVKYKNKVYEFLNEKKLSINKSKEYYFDKNDTWEFLGFSFNNNIVDLSDNTIRKIKGKIKRSAKGIRRWMLKKDANYMIALKAMNRKYNRKFYGNDINNELTWKYWFFPSINTSKSLKIIDEYLQDKLRFIVTGKHNKKNLEKVPYNILKESNYLPLVHEYYKSKI